MQFSYSIDFTWLGSAFYSEERISYSSTVFNKHTVYVCSSHVTVDMILMALDEKGGSLEGAC